MAPVKRRRIHHLAQDVYSSPGTVASLTVCCRDRRAVFSADSETCQPVLDVLRDLHGGEFFVFCYCVMPDHAHLLVATGGTSLSDFVRLFKGRTAARLRGLGIQNLWQEGFYDHLVRRQEDLQAIIRYILMNPVRKGIVENWQRYPWSGSMQWPGIDDIFLSAHPGDVLWSEMLWLER